MLKFKPQLLHEDCSNYPSPQTSNRGKTTPVTFQVWNGKYMLPEMGLRLDIQNLPLSIEN